MPRLTQWSDWSGKIFLISLGILLAMAVFVRELPTPIGAVLSLGLVGGALTHLVTRIAIGRREQGKMKTSSETVAAGEPAVEPSIPDDFFDLMGRHASDRPTDLHQATTLLNTWLITQWGLPAFQQQDADDEDVQEAYEVMRQSAFLFIVSMRTLTQLEPGWSDEEVFSTVLVPLRLAHPGMSHKELGRLAHFGMMISPKLMSSESEADDPKMKKWLGALGMGIDLVIMYGSDDALEHLATLFTGMPHFEFPSSVVEDVPTS